MGRKSRAKAQRKELEYGWVVELSYAGYPAGRYWFNALKSTRTPPPNARRMIHHTTRGGRLEISSSRPASREKE